jgi:hypothetical protein
VTVALGAPAFVDTTLTIDRPHDLDWYRIHIPDANDTLVIRAVARPAGGAPADLDIYLMSGDMLSEIASSFNVGLADSLIVPLVAAGDYVVGVIDFPGVTTKYDLCVTVNTPCTGLHPSPTRRIVGASAKMARKSRATTRPPGTPVAGPASRLWGMRFSPHP